MKTIQENKEDLNLSNIDQFIGTQQYHKLSLFDTNLTDGIMYVMSNGYSWFVTDSLAVIKCQFKDEEFLAVKLLVFDDHTAKMVITDGNEKLLYEQEYKYTDAKKNLMLFYENGVLLLAREH